MYGLFGRVEGAPRALTGQGKPLLAAREHVSVHGVWVLRAWLGLGFKLGLGVEGCGGSPWYVEDGAYRRDC